MTNIVKMLGQKVLRSVMARNHKLGNFQDVFWVLGDGRSGTTWIADLVNFRNGYRKMFEPFHPELVDAVAGMEMHEYIRPDDRTHFLLPIANAVLNGSFFHPRVDSRNLSLRYSGIVVKDIYCNLMAKQVCNLSPKVKPIFVVRNPFAVALSKHKKSDWLWLQQPVKLLNQENLVADYLAPHTDLIRRIDAEGDFIDRQVLIWAIIHSIPFSQFAENEISLLFYEDVYRDPSKWILDVLGNTLSEQFLPKHLPLEVVDKPTRSAGKDSNIALGTSPLTSWKNALETTQIDNGLKLLSIFGLDSLYDQEGFPARTAAQTLNARYFDY